MEWAKSYETADMIERRYRVLTSLEIVELVGDTVVGKFEYKTWEEAYEERDRLQRISLERGCKLGEVRYGVRVREEK